MAPHASLLRSTARRALVALATAGVAVGAGATAAAAGTSPAADGPDRHPSAGEAGPGSALKEVTGVTGRAVGPVADMRPNVFAGTGVDPLSNAVGTEVADFEPVGTRTVTDPVTKARSVGSVPVVGRVVGSVR
ncbi:hypothetical protein [Streptomyces sp. NPDC004065]|uniref:hypothetical protein n=1 Tax=Streptomyces sp. NPDC004065 TaxID=3364689 RepID=UPI00384E2CF6